MSKNKDIVGVIDFGSRAIRVIIGSRLRNGQTHILGYSSVPTQDAVHFGAIQDINLAGKLANQALTQAQAMAKEKTYYLYCGIQGSTEMSGIHDGKVEIENGIIKPEHLEAARHNASLECVTPESRPVSCIKSEQWTVDDIRVADPIGMQGHVLKGRIHFTRLSIFLENNLRTCLENQKKKIADFVYMPLAAAHGCLTLEDIRLGAAVINFGSTSTSITVYNDNRLIATEVFKWGSGHYVGDIAAVLNVYFEEAVELLLDYGINIDLFETPTKGRFKLSSTSIAPPDSDVTIKLHKTVTGAPGTVAKSKLDAVIFERSKQFAALIEDYLKTNNYLMKLSRGLIITGGGAAVSNQDKILEKTIGISTRIGLPLGFNELPDAINTPEWAPTIGILNYAFAHRGGTGTASAKNGRQTKNSFLTPIKWFFNDFIW